MRHSGEPTVSVVLPTLNRRAMTIKAVASVLAQTRPDLELIVVDCGSSDGTQAALAPVLGERGRLLTAAPTGASAARNAGLRDSGGRFVAFLDSDDLWRPDHLAVVCALLERHPRAVLASTCPRFDIAGRESLTSARVVDPLPRILVAGEPGWTACIAARRSDIEAVGGFDERLMVGEGNDLWRRLALRGPFVYLRRRTVTVQQTRGSLSDLGRRRGAHLEGFALSTSRMVAEIERSDRPELLAPARGAVHYARALSAVARGDEAAVRTELRDAVELMPDLSHNSDRLVGMVRWYFPAERGRRQRALESLAAAWPDPRAETAVLLRGASMTAALLGGRPIAALAALRGMGLTGGFYLARRFAFGIPYLLRGLYAAIAHRGREPRLPSHRCQGTQKQRAAR